MPIRTLGFPFDVLGGGQITSSPTSFSQLTGIAVSDAGELWLSHAHTHRVLRLRNPLTAPLVDVLLGQVALDETLCNRGNLQPSSDSLCFPGHVALDRLGNLFVSDDSLEIEGNMRLLEFSKSLFPSGNPRVIYAPPAAGSVDDVATWQPAFDSHNHMVIGYNPYGPGPNPLGGWFPGVYGDPLSERSTPDAYLLDYHSMAYSAAFDENDNLYVADLDRSRVLYYDKPTASLPSIVGFAPPEGPVGSAVTIAGTNLSSTTQLRCSGVSTAFTVRSDMQITATVPAGATTGAFSLSTRAGGARSLADFIVTCSAIPVVTAPAAVEAGSPNGTASAPTHAGSTYAWTIGNGAITGGQGTSQVTFTAGGAGIPLTLSVTETNAFGCVSPSGNWTSTVVPAAPAALFHALAPCRILDTRDPTGPLGAPALQPGATRTFDVSTSACGIPAGAVAISGNLTVTNVGAPGELVTFRSDISLPNASSISLRAGRTRANNAVVALSSSGTTFSVFNGSTATVDFILDVSGFFE